jgi:UDP-glucose 4-epimerase
MKNIWITGARGFIGRHLARRLSAQGKIVHGLGHGDWTESERSHWGVSVWRSAPVSYANLEQMSLEIGLPDAIIHLAGGSSVNGSFAQPHVDFIRTVLTTNDLIEWLRCKSPETRLVFASSAAVYGAGHEADIPESANCNPFSPYGYHKRIAELSIQSYAHSFRLRAAIVRLFSVYGTGLRKQLLWDACTRLAAGELELALGGTGQEARDWLHVEDAVRLLENALYWADPSMPIVNGGTGIRTTNSDFMRGLCAAWGYGATTRFNGISRNGDPTFLVSNPSQLIRLGFKVHRNLVDGVEQYVSWFKQAHL